jgi:glyoxylase-like metal-dependent hydrolase (beta-lactamase superfamily II)
MNDSEQRVTTDQLRLEQICTGIWRLILPLPFLLTEVNIWLLEEADGWTVVDTGFGNQTNEQLWEELFRGLLADKPLKRIILTHYHIDHCALAGWLSKKWDVQVCLTKAESTVLRIIEEPKGFMHKGERTAFYHQHGLADEEIGDADFFFEQIPVAFSGMPEVMTYVADGEKLQIGDNLWEVIELKGHSPGHLTLYCETLGIWISGDHVLPRITPIISVEPDTPDDDPLSDFLESFKRLRQLPESTRVLPSHGNPFVGLHARLDELQKHHDQRLDEVLQHSGELITAAELTRIMFPAAHGQQSMWMAISEVQAHLNLLMYRGKVTRQSDSGGIVRYVLVK